jgi:hypothetical protein
MAAPPEANDPSAAAESVSDTDEPVGFISRWGKSCGCLTGLVVMALGILVIGHFDSASWASALIALTVGVLVFALSGVNGVWEK